MEKIHNLTLEEAIETIKSNYPPDNYTILREALDMAMKSLEFVNYLEKLTTDVSSDENKELIAYFMTKEKKEPTFLYSFSQDSIDELSKIYESIHGLNKDNCTIKGEE